MISPMRPHVVPAKSKGLLAILFCDSLNRPKNRVIVYGSADHCGVFGKKAEAKEKPSGGFKSSAKQAARKNFSSCVDEAEKSGVYCKASLIVAK